MSTYYDEKLSECVRSRMRARSGDREFWKVFAITRDRRLVSPFVGGEIEMGWVVSDRATAVPGKNGDVRENALGGPTGPNPYTSRLLMCRGYHVLTTWRGAMRVVQMILGLRGRTNYGCGCDAYVIMPVRGQLNDFVGAGMWSDAKIPSVVFTKLHISRSRAMRATSVVRTPSVLHLMWGEEEESGETSTNAGPPSPSQITFYNRIQPPVITRAIDTFVGEEWILKPEPLPMRQDYLHPVEVADTTEFVDRNEPAELVSVATVADMPQ